MEYVLTVLMNILSKASFAAQKQYGILVGQRRPSIMLFLTGNSLFAIIIYGFLSGWSLGGNITSVLFGFVYAFVCTASLVVNFRALEKMNLIMISVFDNATVVSGWLVGVLFFKEAVTPTSIAAVVLVFLTVIAPLFNREKGSGMKMSLLSYFIGIIKICVGVVSTVILKLYTGIPSTDSHSQSVMCFYTNVFMIFFIIAILLIFASEARGGMGLTGEIKAVRPICVLLLLVSSAVQIPAMLLNMYILKIMPLSLFTVTNNGVSAVIIYLVSRFVFKEKHDRFELVCCALATLAVLLTAF